MQGPPRLHRQPDRHLLDSGRDQRGDGSWPDRGRGRRRGRPPLGHSQNRRVRADRSGRAGPDALCQPLTSQHPAARRPVPRHLPGTGTVHPHDRGGLHRPQRQGRLLPDEQISRRPGQGSGRSPDRPYRPAGKPSLNSVAAAKGGLRALVEHPDKGGIYARRVLVGLLAMPPPWCPRSPTTSRRSIRRCGLATTGNSARSS